MVVGITHTVGSEEKWQKYLDWLLRADPFIECITLSYKLDNCSAVANCDALVLTGGNDVDPALYGGDTHHPKIMDVDKERDSFERTVLDAGLMAGIPILGICRGMQIANVHFGGSLIPDIEEAGYRSHKSSKDFECYHDVIVEEDSLLYTITECSHGKINSNHHQSVASVGKGLRVAARSDDGIIEALEYELKDNKPFFLLTQWHPERMSDMNNSFSENILKTFLSLNTDHSNIVKGS